MMHACRRSWIRAAKLGDAEQAESKSDKWRDAHMSMADTCGWTTRCFFEGQGRAIDRNWFWLF